MRFRRFRSGRAAALLMALAVALAAPACAQSDRPRSNAEIIAALDPLKATLDAVEEASHGVGNEQTLADVTEKLAPLREQLRGEVEILEKRLVDVDNRLKQLGEPPPATAPPEDPALAAERKRLATERGELDAAVKQARLIALRADQLNDRVTERRRTLLAGRLFARSAGLLDAAFWRDAAAGAAAEVAAARDLVQSSWEFARDKIGAAGVIASILLIGACAAGAVLLTRVWRRRLVGRPAETRFARALVAVVELVSITLVAPLVLVAVVLAFESLGVVTSTLAGLGYGIAAAVAVARFGRGAALALFAPGGPSRRLIGFHDEPAKILAAHLTWAARLVGIAVACNVVFRATAAPVAPVAAVSALMSLAIAALAGHLIARAPDPKGGARLPALQPVLWLFIATVIVALAAGYIGFAAFVAGRFVAALTVVCALWVVLTFVDALFTEELTGDTPAGRAISAAFGISPRGLELSGTLLSAALRILIVLVALPPVIGPWSLFASDVLESLRQVVAGIRVAGITISLGAIVAAFVWLVVGVLVARTAQRWLETRVMPRTGIDPSLQQSVATLIGWTLLIAAIALALAHLGIEAQQIALIAGALSVGIGFGLQSVVSNFVCGIILLAERPIRVGDWVVVKSEEGIVRRISVRATEIETFDRASVIIPNSEFITGAVKNLTHSDTMGRVTVKLRVAFDSDVEAVREILVACAGEHPQVLQTPPPRVYLIAFGDIGLDLELRFIVVNVNFSLTVKSDIQMVILQRLRTAGVRIPTLPHEAKPAGGAPATAPEGTSV
jgi:small-conductance mechanosensitive channel